LFYFSAKRYPNPKKQIRKPKQLAFGTALAIETKTANWLPPDLILSKKDQCAIQVVARPDMHVFILCGLN